MNSAGLVFFPHPHPLSIRITTTYPLSESVHHPRNARTAPRARRQRAPAECPVVGLVNVREPIAGNEIARNYWASIDIDGMRLRKRERPHGRRPGDRTHIRESTTLIPPMRGAVPQTSNDGERFTVPQQRKPARTHQRRGRGGRRSVNEPDFECRVRRKDSGPPSPAAGPRGGGGCPSMLIGSEQARRRLYQPRRWGRHSGSLRRPICAQLDEMDASAGVRQRGGGTPR